MGVGKRCRFGPPLGDVATAEVKGDLKPARPTCEVGRRLRKDAGAIPQLKQEVGRQQALPLHAFYLVIAGHQRAIRQSGEVVALPAALLKDWHLPLDQLLVVHTQQVPDDFVFSCLVKGRSVRDWHAHHATKRQANFIGDCLEIDDASRPLPDAVPTLNAEDAAPTSGTSLLGRVLKGIVRQYGRSLGLAQVLATPKRRFGIWLEPAGD
mmetsp:Transcript_76294/g.182572  ORF Transcript_76294/g.182572 Transcript_76294/m.182572 type:complete len:209 (-) Transcript_76294:190-816(-)